MIERQRTKHDRIERAEYRRRCPDAECERDDRHGRKAARPCELADRERNVVSQFPEILGTTRFLVALGTISAAFSVY